MADQPDDPAAPDENPFTSPTAAPLRSQSRTWRIVLVIVLGVLLTPIAAFIGGFCCCLAALDVDPNVAVAGFFLGALVSGGLVIYVTSRWLRSIANRP